MNSVVVFKLENNLFFHEKLVQLSWMIIRKYKLLNMYLNLYS